VGRAVLGVWLLVRCMAEMCKLVASVGQSRTCNGRNQAVTGSAQVSLHRFRVSATPSCSVWYAGVGAACTFSGGTHMERPHSR
jgi:hypothetical protein